MIVNQNDTMQAINRYLKTLQSRNVKIDMNPVTHIDLLTRLPQMMAVALWQKDNGENNSDVRVMLCAYNQLVETQKIVQ